MMIISKLWITDCVGIGESLSFLATSGTSVARPIHATH